MRNLRSLNIILFFILNNISLAQVSDSLKKVLKTKIHDSTRCEIYMQLIEEEEDLEVWSKYNDELLKISSANLTKYKKGTKAYNTFLKHYAAHFNNNGWISNHKGDVTKALEYYHKSLKIYDELKQKGEVATLYNNIAHIWNTQGEFDKSIEYYQHSINLYSETKNKKGEAFGYNNIAAIYRKKGDNEKALEYCYKSLAMMEELKDKKGTATLYTNIGTLLGKTKQEEKGLEYLQKGLAIKKEIKDEEGTALSLSLIGNIYLKIGKTDKALEYGLQSLELNQQLGYPDHIRRSADLLKDVYAKKGDYKKAMEMFELYVIMKDSVNNEATRKASIKNQLQYEYDKKAATDSIKASEEKKLSQAKLAESQAKLKQEKTQRIALYSGLFLVVIFSIFIFNRFKVTQKQNSIIQRQKILVEDQKHIVEEKATELAARHKEITDSINYAERIQRSFIATKQLLDENLKEYFVLFKPKDIVSGDFYWATSLHDPQGRYDNEKFILCTADSTGHGVPGAIMSLLNVTSLETAIKDGHTEPADILNATRKTIIERLKKDGSADGGKDGMDASLCVFDFKKMKLTIAAANNPVWIMRKNESGVTEALEVKPDKMPIGKHDKDSISFTQQEFDLQKGDVIYSLTDGFPDQFGGPNGKKFMSKKLRELLAANAHLPAMEQKTILESAFTNWLGNHEQVDDVTIIGIKI